MKRIATAGLLGALASGLLGCSLILGPTELEKHWGESYRENKTAMIAHPEAAELNTALPEGLDPATAEQVMENHRRREAQLTAPQAGPSIINIGTSGSR